MNPSQTFPADSKADVRILPLAEVCTSSARHNGPLWERMVFDAIPKIGTLRVGDRTQARPPFMLSPVRSARFAWDFLSLLIIGIETVTVPVTLAFSDASVPTSWVWFVVAFFVADILLNF